MPANNAAACKRLPAPRCLSSPAEYVAHLCQHQCPLYPRKRTLPHAIMTTRPSAAKPCAQLLVQIAFDFFWKKIANGWAAICHRRPRDVARHDTESAHTTAASPGGRKKSAEDWSPRSNSARAAASKPLRNGQGRTIGAVTVAKLLVCLA